MSSWTPTRTLRIRPELPAPVAPVGRLKLVTAFVVMTAVVVVLSAVHLTQGTAAVGPGDLVGLVLGRGDEQQAAVLMASRVPRLLAGLLVGVALGVSGAALQSLARNPLASPDTLGVDAGAYLAVVVVASFGIALPAMPRGGVAFVGGLLAAGLVMALSSGGTAGPTRLVLAGSAVAIALGSLTVTLLLLFSEETTGLFAWGNGRLAQSDLQVLTQMAPVVTLAVLAAIAIGRRLDLLALGADTAASLGLHVRRTRLLVTVIAVALAACAVTVAGPVGFVGLCAPAAVRLVAPLVPGLSPHRMLLPMSGLAGVVVVLGSDVLLRAAVGGQGGVQIPTGVVTSALGAAVLVAMARRLRDRGPTRTPPGAATGGPKSGRRFVTSLSVLLLLVLGAAMAGMLLGDTQLLTGDVVNWWGDRSGTAITFVLDQRFPRVLAALLAGAALGVAGTAVQAVCRNPLAEPGIIGITGGAGVGAVTLICLVPAVGIWAVTGAAWLGATVAFALVYGLAWRGGLSSDRLVLIGVGVSAGAAAVTTFLITLTRPYDSAMALTWLSGSTYGRTLGQTVPVAVALAVVGPATWWARRDLDLLALDDDAPRVLGVRVEATRLAVLDSAALLTATAVSAIGVVGFVGLVAPHAARALVGGRHARVLPVACVLGALLVSVADTLGRTLIAPAQLPAGLVTALVGTPYFVWLLWRSRLRT